MYEVWLPTNYQVFLFLTEQILISFKLTEPSADFSSTTLGRAFSALGRSCPHAPLPSAPSWWLHLLLQRISASELPEQPDRAGKGSGWGCYIQPRRWLFGRIVLGHLLATTRLLPLACTITEQTADGPQWPQSCLLPRLNALLTAPVCCIFSPVHFAS